jgi:hypothetical protein
MGATGRHAFIRGVKNQGSGETDPSLGSEVRVAGDIRLVTAVILNVSAEADASDLRPVQLWTRRTLLPEGVI